MESSAGHVLLVDDSASMREMTEDMLCRAGYTVTLAVDGVDALEKINAARPNYILTDIDMPRLDGYGFIRSLAAEGGPVPPIVLMSCRGMQFSTQRLSWQTLMA